MAAALLSLGLAACASGGERPRPSSPSNDKSAAPPAAAGARAVAPKPKVSVQLFVMSKCPYGAEAERGIAKVVDALGERVAVRLDYIVSERDGKLHSMHGPGELRGDILQLCAQKHHSTEKLLRFITCQNESLERIPYNWEACAQRAGLDQAKVRRCAGSDEGRELLRASMRRARAADATASPTLIIGGKRHTRGRDKKALLAALCQRYGQQRPKACAAVPRPVTVRAVVVTDARCAACKGEPLVALLEQRFFPRLSARIVDYGSAEGNKLYQRYGLKYLPAVVFDSSITRSPNFLALARFMRPAGTSHFQLRLPARFDPTAEICDNGADDTENGKVDCADPTCSGKLICREDKPRRVDLFIMSKCPFGAQAALAMQQVLKNFKGKVAFDLHYIASRKPGGSFHSMHGPAEVAENMRQLCAKKHYAKNDRYLEYVWCRSRDFRSSDWKRCAKDGISSRVIARCVAREGEELLASNIELAKQLDISASPTFLANNRYKFHGIAAERIKQQICKRNAKLAGCANKLDDRAVGPGGGACGAQ